MSVYVDEIKAYPTGAIKPGARHAGHNWCHMWADTSDELHAMATKIGLKRAWFQDGGSLPHYDLVPSKRAEAVANGAITKSLRDALREIRDETGKTPTRTWAYGARLNANILNIVPPTKALPLVVILESEDGEGHMLVGDYHDVDLEAGMSVVMEFTQGGQTGGFWKIIEIVNAIASSLMP